LGEEVKVLQGRGGGGAHRLRSRKKVAAAKEEEDCVADELGVKGLAFEVVMEDAGGPKEPLTTKKKERRRE